VGTKVNAPWKVTAPQLWASERFGRRWHRLLMIRPGVYSKMRVGETESGEAGCLKREGKNMGKGG